MNHHDTIIIGAGQAGISVSHALAHRRVDHLVLERGRIAESWRSQRWDSARLLTPNWMTRLPGYAYRGHDPDGFMTMAEVAAMLTDYAAASHAPIRQQIEVEALRRDGGRFRLVTSAGTFTSRNVVIATGQNGVPRIPTAISGRITGSDRIDVRQIHSSQYRNPDSIPVGGVLVVGAGASGIQIAEELARSGRRVVLAVGRHARAVRRYRNRDLCWWLDDAGIMNDTTETVGDLDAARRTPTLGLSGADGGRNLDLGVLDRLGVETVGRVIDADGTRVRFGDNLLDDVDAAERRLRRLLDRIDAHAAASGADATVGPAMRPLPVRLGGPGPDTIDLVDAGIRSVIWCTGFAPAYPWLQIPVLDPAGAIRHVRGVTPVPGLYVLGLRFLWRRGSHFLDGVGEDAVHVADRIANRAAALTLSPDRMGGSPERVGGGRAAASRRVA